MLRFRHLFIKVMIGVLAGCFPTMAVGEESASRIQFRLEPAPDASELASGRLPHIVVPRLPTAPVVDGRWSAEEWQGAEGTEFFVVPGSGKTAVPQTRAWLGVDTQALYIAVHCGLAPGVEPQAVVAEHDGSVFADDSIEIFVWSGSQSTNYHQIAVNARGVVFDAIHTVDPRTGLSSAHGKSGDWNPTYEKAVGRVKGGWILELAIPLRELGIRPEGVQVVRLNLWRNVVPGAQRFATWSPTPIVDAHILRSYGFAVCTFAAAKGEDYRFEPRADWGHAGVFGLNKNLWAVVSSRRNDIVFWLNLPEKVFSDTSILLTPTITPILAGGTNGTPIVLDPQHVKSPEPTRLVLVGLAPGDYRLSLAVSGGISLPKVGGLVQVREVTRPVTVAGEVVFDDSDWRAEGAVASATKVETSLTPEALLMTEFTRPVPAFDPTDDETITCMAEFKGKLYIGSCTRPAQTDTGSIFTYDPETHQWKKEYQVKEQGLIRLEVYGNTLYVAGCDANNGGWDLGNIYLHDGTNWVLRRTVPRAVHTYGLAVHKDRIYVAADIFDEGLVGNNSKSRVPLYGRVVSSGDGGLTWREEYRGATPGQDVGLLAVFQDQLVLNARGDLFISSGEEWRALHPEGPNFLYVLEFAVDKDRMLLGTPFGLCYFDGRRAWRSPFFSHYPGLGIVRGITRFKDQWVFASYRHGSIRHGPGGTHAYPRLDGGDGKWPKGVLWIVSQEALERDASGETLNWQTDGILRVPVKDVPTCVQGFRGRVYVGTHGEGRVCVLPVAKDGRLEAAPRPIPRAGEYRLYWEAATPPGTTVTFQVRTAATREALAAAPFVGPDGTAQTCFEQSDAPVEVLQAGFIQYRAVLATADPALTPYLKRVVLCASRP